MLDNNSCQIEKISLISQNKNSNYKEKVPKNNETQIKQQDKMIIEPKSKTDVVKKEIKQKKEKKYVNQIKQEEENIMEIEQKYPTEIPKIKGEPKDLKKKNKDKIQEDSKKKDNKDNKLQACNEKKNENNNKLNECNIEKNKIKPYIPYSTIPRIEEPYPDLTINKFGGK